MQFTEILNGLQSSFPTVTGHTRFGCNFIIVDPASFKDLVKEMKAKYGFTYIVDVVATHWPKRKEKFDVVYNLYSISNNVRAFVKVAIEGDTIATVTDIYKGADFMEREQYDLVGVKFEGHPNMKRILLPEFFEGHPLRKDYQLKDRKWFNSADEQGLGLRFTK